MDETIRNKIAEQVREAMSDNGYVFGGFVRDKLAGVPFTDIDVRVDSPKVAQRTIEILKNLGYRVAPSDNHGSNVSKFHSKIRWIIYHPSDAASPVDLDIVCPLPGHENASPIDIDTIDADINALILCHDGEVSALAGMCLVIASRNIRNRKYCSFNSDDPSMAERHAKLKAKGYTDQDDFDFDEEEEEEVYYGIAAPTSNSVPDYKKEVIMNNKNVSELMKRSATAGGYGAVAMQATKRTKGALIKILEKKGADHATMMVVSSLLDTEGGTTLVHLMLGMCCIYAPIPGLKDNEHVQKLGEHFVTKGFETGMSSGMDLLAEVIGPAIAEAFGALQQQRVETPALESAKQRVALVAPSVSDLTESEITAAYEQMQARKAASAGLDRKGE